MDQNIKNIIGTFGASRRPVRQARPECRPAPPGHADHRGRSAVATVTGAGPDLLPLTGHQQETQQNRREDGQNDPWPGRPLAGRRPCSLFGPGGGETRHVRGSTPRAARQGGARPRSRHTAMKVEKLAGADFPQKCKNRIAVSFNIQANFDYTETQYDQLHCFYR